MAKIQPYTEWLNELTSKINNVYEDTKVEYYDFLEDKMRKNYNRIIDIFYNSYDPSFYERRYSLYDLLVMKKDKNGIDIGFDSSKIERRDGYNGKDGLYTTVFLQGFHGGAYIPNAQQFLVPWTAPPVAYDGTSTPWDFPAPWGRRVGVKHGWQTATRTVSPYRLWKSFIDGYNRGQYQRDFDVIWNRNVDKYF